MQITFITVSSRICIHFPNFVYYYTVVTFFNVIIFVNFLLHLLDYTLLQIPSPNLLSTKCWIRHLCI